MPKFIYTAKDYNGETKGGEIVAPDEKSVAQQLRSEGFLITSVTQIKEENRNSTSTKFFDRFKSVPLKEKLIFARNMSVMVASGLTVSRAVNNLAVQTQNKTFKKILFDIYEEMQAGKTLNEGLGKYQSVFGDLFINMVRVGESSGTLEEVLQIVALQLEKEYELRSKIKGAMVYPAVILVVMFVIGIVMLIFVLPKLTAVFEDMNVELPIMTRMVIGLSDTLRNHGLISAVVFAFFIFLAQYFLRQKSGKKFLSWVLLKFPLFSPLVKKTNCARFSRIYSSLLRSGVGSVEALKIISRTLTNYYYCQALNGSVENIQKGVSLSKVLSEHQDIFPILVSQIVEVGEETGKTDTVLMQLAEFYEEEVDQITKNLSSIVEPLLMVIIGVAVGFFAVAMLMPMYSMMDYIG